MSKAYQVVRDFEECVAKYCGSPYAVALESCSAALFLCCKFVNVGELDEVVIPHRTYPSVPSSIINAGGRVGFSNIMWQHDGYYYLGETGIVDSAKRMSKNMYSWFSSSFVCLSFHGKKCLPIGRGGMVLTDSKEAYEWLRWMRFDGRHEESLETDTLVGVGWNMYMAPTQATRGLELMQWIKDDNIMEPDFYPNLSMYEFYKEANR